MRGTAIASDYDGTLCQSNWETGEEHFDPAVLQAVRDYQAAGGLFGICTGRPLYMVVESLKGIVDLDFYIASTGAQVADKSLAPLVERTLDRDVAQQVFERFVSDETDFTVVTDSAFYSIGAEFAPHVPTLDTLAEVEGKLFQASLECHGNEPLAKAMCAELNERFGHAVAGYQNLGSVDVVARGCSKGSGVRMVREALGLDCVAGIGDSYNDLPLLSTADVSYTFCASPAEVCDASTHVVTDLAEAIYHFMG